MMTLLMTLFVPRRSWIRKELTTGESPFYFLLFPSPPFSHSFSPALLSSLSISWPFNLECSFQNKSHWEDSGFRFSKLPSHHSCLTIFLTSMRKRRLRPMAPFTWMWTSNSDCFSPRPWSEPLIPLHVFSSPTIFWSFKSEPYRIRWLSVPCHVARNVFL